MIVAVGAPAVEQVPRTAAVKALLKVDDLCVTFGESEDARRVVDKVSFQLAAGEILGLVGESGSGKSVTALSVTRLLPPGSAMIQGRILWGDEDLLAMDRRRIREVRGMEIGFVFQEPMSALDPMLSLGKQLTETVHAHVKVTRKIATKRSAEILAEVGFDDVPRAMKQYPHELSGGMRQRAMIAIALVCGPKLVIADEPTTALDVSLQAQVLDLLKKLANEHGTSLLLITHDLGVVSQFCDRVVAMYRGRVVEEGSTDEVTRLPKHSHTRALAAATPRLGGWDPAESERAIAVAMAQVCESCAAGKATDDSGFHQVSPTHRYRCLRFLDDTSTPKVGETA